VIGPTKGVPDHPQAIAMRWYAVKPTPSATRKMVYIEELSYVLQNETFDKDKYDNLIGKNSNIKYPPIFKKSALI